MRSRYGRPTAKGIINEQNERLHTGYVNFPDDRTYRFWYHTDEAKIYWDNDKGRTRNIWSGKQNHIGSYVYFFEGKSLFLKVSLSFSLNYTVPLGMAHAKIWPSPD